MNQSLIEVLVCLFFFKFIYFFGWPGTVCSDVYYFRFPHDCWFYEPPPPPPIETHHSLKWDACNMFLKGWLPGCERLAVFSLGPCITWVLCFNEFGLQGKGTPIYSVWPVNWCSTWFENRQTGGENNGLKKQIHTFKATFVATTAAILSGRKWRETQRGMDE